jgi:hypothetical protein
VRVIAMDCRNNGFGVGMGVRGYSCEDGNAWLGHSHRCCLEHLFDTGF